MTSTQLPLTDRPAAPAPWFGGSMPFARFGLIVNLLIPLALLAADARRGMLGADPVMFAIHTTGLTALIYLLLCLCVTPLRMITGFTWLIQFRRSLGVFAFYYACTHLFIYFWWDRQRSLSSTIHEITHRYYLTIGFLCLALMAPLWATSFNAAIRKLGGSNWKRLHRLAYGAAVLGCIHFYLQSKADKRLPEVFLVVLGGLWLWRGRAALRRRRARRETPSQSAVTTGKARYWKGQMRVIAMTQETPAVRTFRLRAVEGPSVPFAHRSGQFLNLSVMIDGQRLSRSYTIASPATCEQHIELTIKREANGQMSRFLHDHLKTGDCLTVAAPAGRFNFDSASADAILLVAGGVGITPIMSIVRELCDLGWAGRMDLLFSIQGEKDVIFAQELDNLSTHHPNLHVHRTFTRQPPQGWTGTVGRIDEAMLRRLVPDFTTRRAFICGPDLMANAIREILSSAAMPPERITVESFTPAASNPQEIPPDTFVTEATLTFVRSGQSFTVPSNRSVLEAAEQAGIRMDFDCRSGICGQCRCKLLTGQVAMKMRDALSDRDEADGYILACQAHLQTDCAVDA